MVSRTLDRLHGAGHAEISTATIEKSEGSEGGIFVRPIRFKGLKFVLVNPERRRISAPVVALFAAVVLLALFLMNALTLRTIESSPVHEDDLLEQRTATARQELDRAIWIDGAAVLGLVLLGLVLFTINRDIARRKQLEQRLLDAAAFQGQFVGILGHDLRNPLSAVAMAATLLQRRGGLTPEQAHSVRLIASSAARMNRMVGQLLDLTRARVGGGIPVDRKAISLSELATSAVEELRIAHPEAEVRLDVESDVRGSWDPDRVAQVISNLVGNAILHGAGPVDVELRQSGGAATLEVRNGGPPIPADRLLHLFEALRPRGANDTTKRSSGLGLGLYIVHEIVAAHGGRIDVSSSEPDGTRIAVTLPLVSGSVLHVASDAFSSPWRGPTALSPRAEAEDRAFQRHR
jgi:signal transduction histidine kinase